MPKEVEEFLFGPSEPQAKHLKPARENEFRTWYAGVSNKLGLDPNPDSPLHMYDWRAAWAAGAEPDEEGHFPSQFKQPGHPTMFKNGYNTKTGQPVLGDALYSPKRTPELDRELHNRSYWERIAEEQKK